MSWLDDLRAASWRGLPFKVLDNDDRAGRRIAPHEYFFRDGGWPEDLGRASRKHAIVGYLVGDDVAAQKAAMLKAAEERGPGELVHPQLGALKVVCMECSVSNTRDKGRYAEVSFAFLEWSDRLLASFDLDTIGNLLGAAGLADLAAEGGFIGTAADALQQGAAVVRQAQATVQSWTGMATRLVGDAGGVLNAVGGLVPGAEQSFGRFAGGLRAAISPATLAGNSVSAALARAAQARSSVAQAASRVISLAGAL